MYYEINLKDFKQDSHGYSIPIFENKSKKVKKQELDSSDCISDSYSIDKEDMCIWFSTRIREDLEINYGEVESFFRQYFVSNDVYTILGFIRKMIEK